MTVLALPVKSTLPSGEIVALDVSAEEYMEKYAASYHEWVNGVVIKMSPINIQHEGIVDYLRDLLRAYMTVNPIGQVLGQPFVMRLDTVPSRREPDLQVILNTNPGSLTPTAMIGAADICIEVVSEESKSRDYGDKFNEYEKGGVREYWIVDPIRQDCHFYRLDEKGIFRIAAPAEHYHTPLLPKFSLHVPTLWESPLPDFYAVGEAVKAMFKAGE